MIDRDAEDQLAAYRYGRAYDLARAWHDAETMGQSMHGRVKMWHGQGLSFEGALRKSGLDPNDPAVMEGVEDFREKRRRRW